MCVCVCVCVCVSCLIWLFLNFSGYMSKSGIADHIVTLFLVFLRNLYIVLHSGCINLYPTHSVGRFPFLHTLTSIYFEDFVIMVILTGVRWYLIVVLICISLIAMLSIFSCAYWPSACLLWRKVCLGLLPTFWSGCLFFVIELYELFVYFGN